jgi:molecular chaperone GrpE
LVQVSVKTGEDIEGKEGSGPEDSKHEEIPLSKMTKTELVEKVKEIQECADQNFDRYLRSRAEIENLKKRSQREKTDLIKFSNETLIKQLLPVVDHLEKAIAHTDSAENEDSLEGLREGVELTLKGLMDTLKKAGLEEVKTAGASFDPNFHEAVSEQEDDSVEPGTVLQELQKGYILNERLIRPAMVIVSRTNK